MFTWHHGSHIGGVNKEMAAMLEEQRGPLKTQLFCKQFHKQTKMAASHMNKPWIVESHSFHYPWTNTLLFLAWSCFICRMLDSFTYDHNCSNQFSGSSGDKNALFKWTLPWFYQLLTRTRWGKYVDTTGKSTLKLVISQSLRAICLERVKL